MSESTPGDGERRARDRRPYAPDGDATTPDGAGPAPVGDDGAGPAPVGDDGARRDRGVTTRRPPLWVLIAAGVTAVLAVVLVVMLITRDAPSPAPPAAVARTLEAEVVTLPVPTPTIEAMAREAGTPFYEALPSTVLAFALAQADPDPTLVTAGALESYRLVYTDGGAVDLTVLTGQWTTPEAAQAVYQGMVGEQGAAAGAGAALEEAPVLVGGAEVGRSTLVPRPDGTGTVTWTNGTVVLQVDGPVEVIRDVYIAFAL